MGISKPEYSWHRVRSKFGMAVADHSPEFVSLCCLLLEFSGKAYLCIGSLHDSVCPKVYHLYLYRKVSVTHRYECQRD